MAEPSLCSRPTDSTKPRMVVVWPFTENVCCPCSSCPLQAALHWGAPSVGPIPTMQSWSASEGVSLLDGSSLRAGALPPQVPVLP